MNIGGELYKTIGFVISMNKHTVRFCHSERQRGISAFDPSLSLSMTTQNN